MKPKTFDLVARFYVLLERLSFGNALNIARRAFIEKIVEAENTLMIGEGNGRFLHECLDSKDNGSITVLDSSQTMLTLLKSRISQSRSKTQVKTLCAELLLWKGEAAAFDVVVTHFFLDLFRPAAQRSIIEKITSISKRETSWINVDYRPLHKTGWFRLVDWLQYRFDYFVSGVETDQHYDPSALIKELGWVIQEERGFSDGAVLAQLYVRDFSNFAV
jgi:ubiquinone/menaquinone biosynthesis C-methylase UbiE